MISRGMLSGRAPVRKLGEVVEFLDHMRRPVTESERADGPYPYYGANGFQGTIDGYLFDEPLLLLAEDGGHFGAPDRAIAYRISGKTWVNNHAHVLRPRVGIDLNFLCRVLENYDVTPWVTGTTRGKLTKAGAAEILVPVPSLPEQRRIAEILDKADALRAKRRAAMAQLDALTQSIFLDMFGDPATNPKGWPVARLGDLCVRVTDGTHQSPRWSDEGHPFIFISNVVSGEITFDTEKFISDETYMDLTRRCPIEVGDVLYSTVGSYGVPALVRSSKKFAFQRHIAHLKPNRALLDSEFLRVMLASPQLKRQADRVARGVAQKTINLAEIKEFLVFKPPLDVQQDLVRRSSRTSALRDMALRSQQAFDDLFSSVQQWAFEGTL